MRKGGAGEGHWLEREARGDKRWGSVPKEDRGARLQTTSWSRPGRGRAVLEEEGKVGVLDGEMYMWGNRKLKDFWFELLLSL